MICLSSNEAPRVCKQKHAWTCFNGSLKKFQKFFCYIWWCQAQKPLNVKSLLGLTKNVRRVSQMVVKRKKCKKGSFQRRKKPHTDTCYSCSLDELQQINRHMRFCTTSYAELTNVKQRNLS